MPIRIILATLASVRLGMSLFIRSKNAVERVVDVHARFLSNPLDSTDVLPCADVDVERAFLDESSQIRLHALRTFSLKSEPP
jgi:hypothetical protein